MKQRRDSSQHPKFHEAASSCSIFIIVEHNNGSDLFIIKHTVTFNNIYIGVFAYKL